MANLGWFCSLVKGRFFEKNTFFNKLNRTSICALMVLKKFLLPCCGQNGNTKVLLDSRILLDNSKNPCNNSLQRPYRGDLDPGTSFHKDEHDPENSFNAAYEILNFRPFKNIYIFPLKKTWSKLE
jgi:hypothetical protein